MSEEKKLTDEEKAIEELNNYRNRFYAEPQGTERAIIANAINDVFCLIHRLQDENKRVKDDKEQIKLFNLAIQNGEVDMSIESEMAKSFYYSIVQIFEQNEATNFFTTTVDIEGKKGRYAFTIEKVGGQTVAEKLAEKDKEIKRLTEQFDEKLLREIVAQNCTLNEKNAELQKQVDELKKECNDLLHERQMAFMDGHQQAEKDTARKIWDDCIDKIMRGCGDDKEFWVVEILSETFKKYEVGFEVDYEN